MRHPQCQQDAHRDIYNLPVPTIQLGHGGEDEGERHVLEEIVVGALVEVQRVGGGGGVERLAHVFLRVDPVRHDAVAEDHEVGGEGERPCAGYGCGRELGLVRWRASDWGWGGISTQHFGDRDTEEDCRAHGCDCVV